MKQSVQETLVNLYISTQNKDKTNQLLQIKRFYSILLLRVSVISADVLLERTLVAKLFEYICNCSLVYGHISWINKLMVSIDDSYLDSYKHTVFCNNISWILPVVFASLY